MNMPKYFKVEENKTDVRVIPIDDVVEVVRCEDCKYWGVYDEPIKHCMKGMLKLPVHGYEFCCRGERTVSMLCPKAEKISIFARQRILRIIAGLTNFAPTEKGETMPKYIEVEELDKLVQQEIDDCIQEILTANDEYIEGLTYVVLAATRVVTIAKNMPSIEIVRCKDCIHYDMEKELCRYPTRSMFREKDDFCKRGERKEAE